jgi:hypothetical protein
MSKTASKRNMTRNKENEREQTKQSKLSKNQTIPADLKLKQ